MLLDPSESPVAFLIYFLALWVAVTSLLGFLSGWPMLAREYRAANRPSGTTLRGEVSRIGIVPEHNVTGMVVSEQGLYLWTLWPFRLLRPPLLIPWANFQNVRQGKFLWRKWYVIETETAVPIAVSAKAYEAIRKYLPSPLHAA
jgi:hypothetical protein